MPLFWGKKQFHYTQPYAIRRRRISMEWREGVSVKHSLRRHDQDGVVV